ncbi:MAG: immunity protein Tsi6 family protein [Aliiglaciecola sp.]|uniref:immunity protein Tsi6 family protein n=1 Tax=Aliiglaciecola sp. TaxID=1872441 RepID=UPI003297F9BA
MCREKRSAILPQLFESIENQLNWLFSFFEGKNSDRQKLYDLSFGHYVVHEIAPREEELVDALNRAIYVAARTRQGLKLDLKVLGIDS